jgi:hypothetical protein
LWAEFVNRIDHRADMLRIDVRQNAVTQIEHMSGTLSITAQDFADLLANHIRICIQRDGIHIAL